MSDVLDDFLSEDELAKALDLTPRTLQRWRAMREGPNPTFVGKRVFYNRNSVRVWLEQRERRMVRARMRGVPD